MNWKKACMSPWFMCLLAALFYGYEYMIRVMPSVTIDHLATLYASNLTTVGILSAAYYYAYVPMQLLVGILLDHYGVKRLLTMATVCCALGTWLFDSGYALLWGYIGRLLAGFGSAFAFVAVLKIAAEWLPKRYFSFISGAATTLGTLGAIMGEYALSKAIKHTTHGVIQGTTLGIGLVLAVLCWLIIRDQELLAHEKKLLPQLRALYVDFLKVLRLRQIWWVGLIGLLYFMPTVIFADLWGVTYLVKVYHMSKAHAASMTAMVYMGWIVGGPLFGWLSGQLQRRALPLFVGGFIACLAALLMFCGIHWSQGAFQILSFIMGVGSSAEVLVFAVGYDLVPKAFAGTVVALINCFVMMSGLLQPMFGWLLQHAERLVTWVPMVLHTPEQAVFMLLPVAFALGVSVVAFCLTESYRDAE